jgi:uncharacterized OsmC-like protein
MQVITAMPAELGGEGNQVTPGWLLRAGLASCLATRIAMEAAADGMHLKRLEVTAKSTSDVRGLLGIPGDEGQPVTPAPLHVRLDVSIAAANVSADRIQAMVEGSFRCSPVSAALEQQVAVELRVACAET